MKQDGLKRNFVLSMQRKILSGEYKIGQLLPSERELAAQLGVSRSLVNSGILELAEQGFIRIMPRRGSIVADYKQSGTLPVLDALISNDGFRLDYPLFSDLTDIHILLEGECARRASQFASQEDLKQLRMLVNAILDVKQPLDAVEPIVQFNRLLTRCSGNSIFVIAMNSIEPMIYKFVRKHYSLESDMPKVKKQYDSLMRSLEARDPEASARDMRFCIQHSMDALKKLYRP